jgi:hypothetical protein
MDNPSGALMIEHYDNAADKNMVDSLLKSRPSTKGDDRILLALMWRKLGITFKGSFKKLRTMPSPESIMRRRRELQAEQRERVRDAIFARHPEYVKDDLDRALAQALDGDLSEYGEPCNIQPTARTRAKRGRREEAMHNNYGGGATLSDFLNGDDAE